MKDFTRELNEALRLNEDRELYQGIFWIVDMNNLENNKPYCITIPSDSEGNVDGEGLTAKSGTTHNHKKMWEMMDHKLTKNKSFDYYPRGRVQIANNKAIIYMNLNIYKEEIVDFIVDTFNLTKYNGINKIVPKADGSSHYKCCLDR